MLQYIFEPQLTLGQSSGFQTKLNWTITNIHSCLENYSIVILLSEKG